MIIDRNLLFAVLALQGDFLARQQFLEVCRSWAPRKHSSLAELLVQSGWLTAADKAAVDRLIERKLGKQNGDVRATLLAHTDEWMRQSLLSLGDAGIAHVLSAKSAPTKLTPPVAPQPQFGRRERYTLSRLHASGGLGHIWIAHDPDLDRDVALKEIRPEHGDQDETVRMRFLGEARITGRLEHPGVVPVYELSQDSAGRPFYAMRFIQGRTLTDAIEEYHQQRVAAGGTKPAEEAKGQPLPFVFRELLRRFIGVCQTVGYAHSKGIIHRDLKTDNVMLGDFGETLIVDWGLAKPFGDGEVPESWLGGATMNAPAPPSPTTMAAGGSGRQSSSALTQDGNIIGTPMFMAPEQTIGNPQLLGPWTDIHALGLMLYILLTGKAPYDGEVMEVMLKVRNRLPVPPSHLNRQVPRALEAVCLKALAKQPADRYPSAAELAEEIQRWLADEPVQACREAASVRLRRWVKRNRTLVTGAGAAMLVGMVALVIATVFLTAANQREREAAQQAALERDRADKNLELARKAVDDTLASVAAHPRLRQPDLIGLRRQLLSNMVPFYEQFAQQRADDPRLEAERGMAYGQLARVHHSLGQTDLAIKELREKEAIFRKLMATHAQTPPHSLQVASTLNSLSIMLRAVGRREESTNALMDAIRLLRYLPPDARPPELMAACLVSHGNLLQEDSDHHGAAQAFREARQLFLGLSATKPDEESYRHGLAACENNLGIILSGLDQTEEADEMLRHAVTLREKMWNDRKEPENVLSLACTYGSLANHWSKQSEKRQEAGELYRKAVTILEPLIRKPEALPEYRREMALLLRHQIKLLDNLGRLPEAEPSARLAIEQLKMLHQESRGNAYRIELGIAYGQLGDVLQAKEQHEAALPPYADAITLLHAKPGQDPLPQVRQLLRDTLGQRAEALTHLGRHEEALKDWESAITLSAGDADLFRVHHAASLARAGKVPAALAAAERWDSAAASGPMLLVLARLHSVVAKHHPDTTQRETCAARALELLGLAYDANAFKERRNQAMLTKCKDFDILRGKPEFQKLLKEVTGG
jgi:eukaryotic-like serine/threonine-protein kinase